MPGPAIPLEAIQQPAFLYGTDAVVMAANRAGVRLSGMDPVGLPAGDLADRLGLLLTGGPAADLMHDSVRRALAGEDPPPLRGELSSGANTVVAVEIVNCSIREGDRFTGALSVWLDVTECHRSNRDPGFHALLFDQMADAVIATDTGLRVTAWNRAAEELYGWPAGDAIGRHVLEVTGSAIPWADLRESGALLDQEEHVQRPDRKHHRDGRPLCVEGDLAPVRAPDSSLIGYVAVNRDVTEPERLRRELGESEEKYRNLVELSPDAILIHQDGVIVFANPAAAALVGTGTPADLNGRRIMEIVHPGGREDVAWNIAADLRGEESPLTTVGILRPDGTTVVVQGRGSMIPFGGRPAVQVVLRDVTDEKCAEAALRASEDRLRSVLEISLDAVYRRDLVADRYDYVSPVIEAITGLSADEFARLEIQEVLDRIHPDDRAVVQAAIEEGAEALSGTVEYRLRHRDGSYRWVSDYFVVQVDAEGRPVLRGGVLRDVTQRRRIEDALRESEERLRLAQEGADVAVWDWDVLTGEQTHTSGLPRLYGADGRIGRYDLWREHVHPDDIKRLESERDAALARSEPFDIEFRVVHPTGEVRWLAAIGRGHYDETGTLVRVLGVNLDITERKETELRIARYANEVERSNEELQRFAYVASHDLQEPLRSIISFSQLLERRYRGKLDQDADDYIGFIVEGGLRMQALIRDLLQFSRVETQARPLAPTDAREVVADVLRAMRTLLRETGATVMVDDLPVVKADGSQLEQVFSNLIANAIKYRRPGVPPEVRISATRKGGWWEFSVADNGIGIEAEYYDLIFEMFRRLHTHDKYDGTGIGLAVVQRIVARHGGTVRVESTLGEGSTFFFTLPAA